MEWVPVVVEPSLPPRPLRLPPRERACARGEPSPRPRRSGEGAPRAEAAAAAAGPRALGPSRPSLGPASRLPLGFCSRPPTVRVSGE